MSLAWCESFGAFPWPSTSHGTDATSQAARTSTAALLALAGYELKNAMSWGQGKYDEAAAIFILLFAAIVAFDQLSSHVRERLVKGAKA